MNYNRGQSVIELLVAISIFVMAMAASFQLFFGGQTILADTVNAGLAYDYAQEGIDAVRSIRDRNWGELNDGNYGLSFDGTQWNLSPSSDSQDIFTRSVRIAFVNDNLKIATTTITWQTEPGKTQKLEIAEQLARWENLTESSCKIGPLTGNWSSPRTIGTADLGAGNEGTDVVVKLPYAYVSGVASASSKPDIFVFDVSNPASPTLVASKDIGAGGINSLYIAGNYLYAASSNNSKELIIFNISNPTDITVAGSLDLSGGSDGLSVIVFGNTAAIGRDTSSDPGIFFVNVSNPSSPTLISHDRFDGKIKDFTVADKRLYAVTTESGREVRIYNIDDPAVPSLLATYDVPGVSDANAAFTQLKGGQVNLLIGTTGSKELIILGATTTNLYVRDRIALDGDINDITCVEGDLAFLATANANKEFLIVNISNPDNITEYASLNYPQLGTGIDFADNHAYMSVRSNDSLRIITSSP